MARDNNNKNLQFWCYQTTLVEVSSRVTDHDRSHLYLYSSVHHTIWKVCCHVARRTKSQKPIRHQFPLKQNPAIIPISVDRLPYRSGEQSLSSMTRYREVDFPFPPKVHHLKALVRLLFGQCHQHPQLH